MQYVKPLKRFGQNYLKDQNILNKILDVIDPQPEDNIIEIGPGLGALTEKLLTRVNSLTAVEIDSRAAEILQEKFSNVRVIQQDFLTYDLDSQATHGKKLRIVGNIPYNLTSPILFKMIKSRSVIKDSVLMVQLEVAKRMTGEKGTKDYAILAVLLKYFCITKLMFKVSPNAFYPRPNVDSAVVHLAFNDLQSTPEEDKAFITVVKSAFGNRRKTLKNSLSNSILKDVNFAESGIDLSLRAEQLDVKDFLVLADFVRKKNFSSL